MGGMKTSRALVSLLLSAWVVWGQAAPSPKDREIEDLLTKAGQAAAAGNKAAAVGLLEGALQKVQKDPSLKEREPDVLSRLGKAYVDAQRPADAVRTYQILIEELKADCKAGGARVDRCAEGQYGLGTAQMYQGDFAGAAVTLQRAIASFAVLVKGSYTEDYRMARLKQQGDARALLAAALFRTGNKPEAIAAFERAIQEFAAVEKNAKSGETLRSAARTSMKDAQTSLDLLKKN